MVGALVITVLAILAFVVLRDLNTTQPDIKPTPVDYRAGIRYLQRSGDTLVYPSRLPKGWIVTHVDTAPGKRPGLGLSMLTADGQYVGLQQSPQSLPELLTMYVDPSPTSGPRVHLPSGFVTHWATWTDAGGDTALAGRWHHESLLVFGSASRADLETVAKALTTNKL